MIIQDPMVGEMKEESDLGVSAPSMCNFVLVPSSDGLYAETRSEIVSNKGTTKDVAHRRRRNP
jgi:hypothetical protein